MSYLNRIIVKIFCQDLLDEWSEIKITEKSFFFLLNMSISKDSVQWELSKIIDGYSHVFMMILYNEHIMIYSDEANCKWKKQWLYFMFNDRDMLEWGVIY